MRCLLLCLVLILSQVSTLSGQDQIPSENRLKKIILYGSIGYGATLFTLSQAWYKEQGFENFKFFNDNAEWKQVDKIGHVYSTYHFARISYELLKTTHLNDRKALYWSSAISTLMLLPVEILDGFSPDFGFSYGDMIAKVIHNRLKRKLPLEKK